MKKPSILSYSEHYILVADSGSTKTDWSLLVPDVQDVCPKRYRTQGINPFHQSEEQILAIINTELLDQLTVDPLCVSEVHFYGAGCVEPAAHRVSRVLQTVFAEASCTVDTDLLGAARAVCGHDRGIVCILGTGSNSCLYDGKNIVENIPPLGYILGDEGSGAVLGRMLLNTIFKDPECAHLKAVFLSTLQLSYQDVIHRVYREPLANRFLASLVPFVKDNLDDGKMLEIAKTNFSNFLINNVLRYHTDIKEIYAVGGMADVFSDQLREVISEHGFVLSKVMRSPIEGLEYYHAESV